MTHTHLTLVQRRRIYSLGLAGFAAVAVCIATLAVFAQSAYAQDTTAEGEAGVSANAQNDPVSIEIEASGEVMPSPQKPHRPVPMPPSRGDRPVHKPGDDEARAVSPRDRSPTPPPSHPPRGREDVVPVAEKQRMENLKEKAQERFEERKEKAQERLEERKEQILERVRERLAHMFRRVKERLEAAVARLEKLADKLERRITELEERFGDRGFDGSAARAKLAEARDAIAKAREAVAVLSTEISVDVAPDDQTAESAEEINEMIAKLREKVRARREQVRETIAAIKRAHAALVATVREVRAALGSVRSSEEVDTPAGETSTETSGEVDASVSGGGE